jgi:hypothetical protein
MNDFVDRMLGRSAGSAIRPLLPTLYEPITRGGVDESLPMGTFTSTGHPLDTEPAAVEQLSVPTPVYVMPAAPQLRAPTQIAASVAAAPSRPIEPAPVAAPHPVVPAKTAVPSAPPPRRPADPVEARARVEQPSPSGPPAAPAPSAPPPVQRPTVTPTGPTTEHDRFRGRTKAFQQALVQQRDRVREPDVHISIGRVEIKAARPTSAPARRADSARRPQLTLDDYLKSRGS